MAGLESKNLVQQQGSSWEELFSIDVDSLTNITRSNFFVHLIGNDIKSAIALCWYTGTADITLAELANLPLGSVIFDISSAAGTPATPAIIFKVAAAGTSTWKLQAVNT